MLNFLTVEKLELLTSLDKLSLVLLDSCLLSIYEFWLNSQGKSGQNRGKKVGHESVLNFKEEDAFGSEASEKHNEDLWHHFDTHLSDLAVSYL